MMKTIRLKDLPKLPKMKLAVVGHVEWVDFLRVDELPKPGMISHSTSYLNAPAGGGAVIAVKLSQLLGQPIHFITALGKDYVGRKSEKILKDLGLKLNIAWRNQATRKAISLINPKGDRAITVIGERLEPSSKDDLDWDTLNNYDGVFVTAADAAAIKCCRKAKFLGATPRVKLKNLEEANVEFDALIGSGLDPDEKITAKSNNLKTKLTIQTEGENGGCLWPHGRYEAVPLDKPMIDSYGCGDSFAAGVTAGLSAGWTIQESISLGADCGAKCAMHLGPYFF